MFSKVKYIGCFFNSALHFHYSPSFVRFVMFHKCFEIQLFHGHSMAANMEVANATKLLVILVITLFVQLFGVA
jgi:hypothetical protein